MTYAYDILVNFIDDMASIYERMYWIGTCIASFMKRFRIKKKKELYSK